LSPKITREVREIEIIEVAQKIIRKNGLVNFKMSDLSKKAKMSVGTIYSHFPSKEDLFLGIHLHHLKKKEAIFFKVFDHNTWSSLEKVIAMTLSDLDYDRKMMELSEVHAIAMFPSVWEKASPGITSRLEESSQCLGDVIKVNIDQAIREEGIQLNNDLPSEVSVGVSLWGLGLGLHHVFRSFCMKAENINSGAEELIVAQSFAQLIKGLGAKTELNTKDILNLLKEVQTLTTETLS